MKHTRKASRSKRRSTRRRQRGGANENLLAILDLLIKQLSNQVNQCERYEDLDEYFPLQLTTRNMNQTGLRNAAQPYSGGFDDLLMHLEQKKKEQPLLKSLITPFYKETYAPLGLTIDYVTLAKKHVLERDSMYNEKYRGKMSCSDLQRILKRLEKTKADIGA